jgi:DnaK suppressor protein
MRADELLRMRSDLIGRRTKLRSALVEELSALRELSLASNSSEMADLALEHANEDVTSQLAECETRELHDIDAALERIADGTYGDCQNCGQPIPRERLRALPYAMYCIACQVKFENSAYRD